MNTNEIHIMLALETMGNGHNAAIMSAGIIAFKLTAGAEPDIIGELEAVVDLDSAVRHGGVIDSRKALWWMQPAQEPARADYLGKKNLTLSLGAALNEISHFIRNYSAVEPLPLIWGDGNEYNDTIVLRTAYQNAGVALPWKYRQERCFRTVHDVLAPDVIPPKFEGIRHTAKAEALLRARWLHRMLRN